MIKVLLVCSTNISLSPLAQAILCRELEGEGLSGGVQVESAGCAAGNEPRGVDHRMLRLAKARGLDLSAHRSRQLEALELSDYTLALAMSEDDFWHLKALAKEKYCKIRINLYQEYSGQLGLREVPDPLLGEISFEAAYLVLEQTAKKLVRPIRELSLNANWQK